MVSNSNPDYILSVVPSKSLIVFLFLFFSSTSFYSACTLFDRVFSTNPIITRNIQFSFEQWFPKHWWVCGLPLTFSSSPLVSLHWRSRLCGVPRTPSLIWSCLVLLWTVRYYSLAQLLRAKKNYSSWRYLGSWVIDHFHHLHRCHHAQITFTPMTHGPRRTSCSPRDPRRTFICILCRISPLGFQ